MTDLYVATASAEIVNELKYLNILQEYNTNSARKINITTASFWSHIIQSFHTKSCRLLAASNLEKDPQEMASATRCEHSVSVWSMLNRKDVSVLPHYIGRARPKHYIAVSVSDCVPREISLLQLTDFLSAWVLASAFYQNSENFQNRKKESPMVVSTQDFVHVKF